MTVQECIDNYNEERPNQLADDLKIRWLKRLELLIMNEVILTHEGFEPYLYRLSPDSSEDFDEDTELIIKEPYTDVYMHYIDMRAAMNANDTKRYNAAASLYNNALVTFHQFYNKTHKPRSKRSKLLRHDSLI
jgi:hypothetical protein